MRPTHAALALLIGMLAPPAWCETREELARQVRDAENAFAQTMAARDLEAFAGFLADDAIFFGRSVARGRDAVIESWKKLYEGKEAPFSWKSESVEVLDSGTLAHSSGPVLDPQGRRTATFNSIWRRESDGQWKVVFDKGCDACACTERAQPGESQERVQNAMLDTRLDTRLANHD
jgi:ketosteroid isomerase-like protein